MKSWVYWGFQLDVKFEEVKIEGKKSWTKVDEYDGDLEDEKDEKGEVNWGWKWAMETGNFEIENEANSQSVNLENEFSVQ